MAKKEATKKKAAKKTKAKPKTKRKASAAFMRPLTLSATLQDSKNRRNINADAKLKAVFGKAKVNQLFKNLS
jgi:upstream activation factor subunit UAF30